MRAPEGLGGGLAVLLQGSGRKPVASFQQRCSLTCVLPVQRGGEWGKPVASGLQVREGGAPRWGAAVGTERTGSGMEVGESLGGGVLGEGSVQRKLDFLVGAAGWAVTSFAKIREEEEGGPGSP